MFRGLFPALSLLIPEPAKRRRIPACCAFCWLFALVGAHAPVPSSAQAGKRANPYVRSGDIGKIRNAPPSKTSATRKPFTFIPLDQWKGHRFIFLPQSRKLQKHGYQNVAPGRESESSLDAVPYEELVGRIGVVTEVTRSDGEIRGVLLRMEDNESVYHCASHDRETVDNLALVADLDDARARWLGKTLWVRSPDLSTYSEKTDDFKDTALARYSPVKVVDIVAGWYEHQPVRFILRSAAGNEGFQDVYISKTNVSVLLQEYNHFRDCFFEQDPRKLFPAPARIWKAIDKQQVLSGMTSQQVRLSWGDPVSITVRKHRGLTEERWLCPGRRVAILRNGRLVGTVE